MRNARSTRDSSADAAIAQTRHPTRKEIKHGCQLQPPLLRPNGGDVPSPFFIGSRGRKVAIQTVRSKPCARVASRRDGPMAWPTCSQFHFSHETSHALARTPEPLSMELGMHARTAVPASVGMVRGLNALGKLAIFSAFADSSGVSARRRTHSSTR